MNVTSPPVEAAPRLKEDKVRADCYALIARLFHAAPDEELLASIELANGIAGEGETVRLAAAWRGLGAAAAAMDGNTVRKEYEREFAGAGKAEIKLCASHYLAQAMGERMLVQLHQDLARLDLAQCEFVIAHGDHIAGLCEVMRQLIAAGSNDAAARGQKVFFSTYIDPCYAHLCAAVEASSNTHFYKYVARFAKSFLDVEAESFDLTK